MEIKTGIVKYKDREDILCTYAVMEDGAQYYFLDASDEKKLSNGNRIASTALIEAVDPMVRASNIGVIDVNGNVVIPFNNRSIKDLGNRILLVEPAVPTTPSVIEANQEKNNPASATRLVSTPAQIKGKMNEKMGSTGRYVFNDQFSEATICDENGNNLLNGEYFSFIGISDDKLYLSKNTVDSSIYAYSMDNSSSKEKFSQGGPSQFIDVSQVEVSKDSVENALNTGEKAESVDETINNSLNQEEQIIEENIDVGDEVEESSEVAEESVNVADDQKEVVEETTDVGGESNEIVEDTTNVVAEPNKIAEETTDVAEESSEVVEENVLESENGEADLFNESDQEESTEDSELSIDFSKDDDGNSIDSSFEEDLSNQNLNDDLYKNLDSFDNVDEDDDFDDNTNFHEVEADSITSTDYDSFDDSLYETSSNSVNENIMDDLAKSMSGLLKQNKSLKDTVVNYEKKLGVYQHRIRLIEQKNASLSMKMRKLESNLKNLEDKLRAQAQLIESQSRELKGLRPQGNLYKLLEDAHTILEEDNY